MTPPDAVTLDPLPGQFTLTRTDDALTAYGGLVAWSGFLKHLGLFERFAERCPVAGTSPNAAPVLEIVHSFALSALVEGKRFCHVRWLTDDPAIATIMNMDRVRGKDALPRLAKEMSVGQMRDWLPQPQTELYAALPAHFIADWDSTVNTRYGHQEDAALGYNPHKRGRKSHHPLICVAARTRLCLHLEWRSGGTVSATDWPPAMEQLWSHPTIRERLWLNRGDVGFGQEAIMAWHEGGRRETPEIPVQTATHHERAAGHRQSAVAAVGRRPHAGLSADRRDDGEAARLEPGTARGDRAHGHNMPMIKARDERNIREQGAMAHGCRQIETPKCKHQNANTKHGNT